METKQMKAVFPNYYKSFQCIGGKCEDTCCAGWYLPVDELTYKKYKKVKHPEMKKRLDKEIVVKKGAVDPSCVAKIKLKNGRCAFLSKEGWCEVYTELGESFLSESCTCYPRTANDINKKIEYSLTLSCPEAARQVLLIKEGITFKEESLNKSTVTISATIKADDKKPKKWEDYLENYRKTFIEILQNREKTLEQRLDVLLKMSTVLDEQIKRGDLKKIANTLTHQYDVMEENDLLKLNEYTPLMEYLKTIAESKKLHSKSYQERLRNIVEMDYTTYTKASEVYKTLFSKQVEYILENYFVNYIYERCVPLDAKTPSESIKQILCYYQLIHLHFMGMIMIKGSLEEQEIVSFIQGYTKVYDHGEEYIQKISKIIKK